MSSIIQELEKRRTFAIISHPDAGKTTLTEKFLLFGGAIQTAGAVKSNKIKKTATSDFMEIEKQRGISVATSVMGFNYADRQVNILDTPGHKDFAEDTYRTLTAVDSVILVVDCQKGVEAQTERLMEVCRMRNTPVIIFINKLDREGKDPFDLLDELEEQLNISVRPLSWPIGMGASFQGVYKLYDQTLRLFSASKTTLAQDETLIHSLEDPALKELIGDHTEKLIEDVELIEGVYEPFDEKKYKAGNLAPAFFGSAINNFGVKEILDTFISISPQPQPREATQREVLPEESQFTGFVFKIHANLDPRHRDRIAFLRVCSGKFERNQFYVNSRTQKKIRFSNPVTFMAQEKSIVENAYPGDVIGLYDAGNFKIGDTLTEKELLTFKGMPSFSPEIFRELVNLDPMKSKQLDKGIRQLTDEGVAQLFSRSIGNVKIIGTVGELQFDVIQYRLEHEYGAKCKFTPVNYHKAYWLTSSNEKGMDEFIRLKGKDIAYDKDENPVFLAQSAWIVKLESENNPDISFHDNSEFKLDSTVTHS
jgi:peptide chain release factor 3